MNKNTCLRTIDCTDLLEVKAVITKSFRAKSLRLVFKLKKSVTY